MTTLQPSFTVADTLRIIGAQHRDRCLVAPSPELADKISTQLRSLREAPGMQQLAGEVRVTRPARPGLDDGLIIPGSYFPLGTSVDRVRSAAADRAPLRGTVRVVVVLVDFSDLAMAEPAQHFTDLFFSTGVLANGSVKEYFADVTGGLVDITGEVVGPYRLPMTLAQYCNGDSGTGSAAPNARTMARDAAVAADPDVNFGPYDNDGNGFVDAFIVVHAGPGAEQSGNPGHIWSHKWVLAGGEYVTDSTKIYGYLTVPEDARIGVCAHELGHLLFGFPDLYDTDNTSEGIGNWCLMAGGSWNGGGDVPSHPSAWCKSQQGWVTVQNVATNGPLSMADVKTGRTVYRLWKSGAAGQEYFLLENRQLAGYDAQLPGGGLLIWHIDDAIGGNSNEAHYQVALEQADGARHLENNNNRGDAGDPYPGSAGNRTFTDTTTPNSKSYASVSTCVSVTAISDPGPVMTADVSVTCGKALRKDFKDVKDSRKDRKEKEFKERKEIKEKDFKERKEVKEFKEFREKELDKRPEKPVIDKAAGYDKAGLGDGRPGEWPGLGLAAERSAAGALEERVAALEAALYGNGEPFIGEGLRPDLRDSALSEEPDVGPGGPLEDKRGYDSAPPMG